MGPAILLLKTAKRERDEEEMVVEVRRGEERRGEERRGRRGETGLGRAGLMVRGRYLRSVDRHNEWLVSAFIAGSGESE